MPDPAAVIRGLETLCASLGNDLDACHPPRSKPPCRPSLVLIVVAPAVSS